MICNKKHRYLSDYEELPYAQDNNNGDRHICAGCAYEEGLKDGLAGIPQKQIFHICRLVKQELFAIKMQKKHTMRVMHTVEKDLYKNDIEDLSL